MKYIYFLQSVVKKYCSLHVFSIAGLGLKRITDKDLDDIVLWEIGRQNMLVSDDLT